MQQDRNYRYAPTFSGGVSSYERRSDRSRQNGSICGDCTSEHGTDTVNRHGCGGEKEHMVLAMAYVPSQQFENVYSCADGLRAGTIFKDLYLPYGGRS